MSNGNSLSCINDNQNKKNQNLTMNMQTKVQGLSSNWLLNATSPACQAFLAAHMVTKQVKSGVVLHEANAPLRSIIFPDSALISLQANLNDGRTVEKISVGKDGCIGMEYMLGARGYSSHAVVALPGRISYIPVAAFIEAMDQFPCLQAQLSAYALQKNRQLMQTIACASHHSASQRLATWLLHANDRTNSSSFHLTQRILANIFGLRLATINDACARLQATGAIDHSRGVIRIANRALLLEQACECYETIRQP